MVAAVLCVADRLLVLPRTVGSAGGRVGLLLRVWPARVLTGAFCCVVAVCLLCPLRADVGANDLLVQIGDLLEQFLERAMLLDPFLNFLKHIHGDVQALGLSSYLLSNSERTMFVTACAATVGLTQVTPTFVSVPCSVGPKEANLLTLASRLACRPRWRVLIPWLHLCGSGVLNTAFLLNFYIHSRSARCLVHCEKKKTSWRIGPKRATVMPESVRGVTLFRGAASTFR
jgi:hypothetical protein